MNDSILGDARLPEFSLPPELIEKGWLGYDPATDEQIAAAEARLGVKLPPSYKQFLRVSNGWRMCNPWVEDIYPVEKIDFIRNTDPDLVEYWDSGDIQAGGYSDPIDVSHVAGTIRLSEWGDMTVVLFNPAKTTPQGEWEAWYYSDNLPGATVYPSFWDLMEDLLEGQLSSAEEYEHYSPPPPKEQPALHEIVMDSVERVRVAWLFHPDYKDVKDDIDAIIDRLYALPTDDEPEFRKGLRVIYDELMGNPDNKNARAQELLISLINRDAPVTPESARRQAFLTIATVIEIYL